MDYPIAGVTAPGFERVREVFEKNFTDDVEVGAGFCAIHSGRIVVDLWGGYHDQAGQTAWTPDTLVNVYSTTKGLAALAFATVVEDGLIDYEAPVAEYWPELKAAANGLTVAELLSHQGGLCGVSETISVADLYDWEKMCHLLEQQEPFWPPGSAAGYHAILWGYLPGELARRTTGKRLGELLRERITGPLGADFYIGLPDSEMSRVAPMIGVSRARIQQDLSQFADLTMSELYPVALQNPVIRPYKDASSDAWRRAEISAANGQGNAKGIATVYAAAAMGGAANEVRILKPETLAALTRERVGMEPDLVLGRPIRRGAGVILNTEGQYGPNIEAFGHSGAGGSIGFADPASGLAIGYAMNQMQNNLDNDTRGGRLLRAVYESLEAV